MPETISDANLETSQFAARPRMIRQKEKISTLQSRLTQITLALAVYALGGGLLTLVGWFGGLPRLTDWLGSGILMFANTAVAAVCAATALLIWNCGARGRGMATRVLGLAVATIGGATLFQHLSGINLGIDTLLIKEPWSNRAAMAPGRMGPPASFSYLLIGSGLILLNSRSKARRALPTLGMLVMATALLGLIGYLFHADPLFSVARITGVAMQTATILLALGLALVASAPDLEPVRTLRQNSAAGVLTRSALPFVGGLPVFLGWIFIRGRNDGWFDRGTGTAMLVLALIAFFCGLLWWCATAVAAHEKSSRDSEGRFRSIVTNTPECVKIVAVDGAIIEMNNAGCNMVEAASPRKILGRNIYDLIAPEHRAAYRLLHEKVCAGSTETLEFDLIGLKGTRRRMETTAVPIPNPHGEGNLHLALTRDVTERKRIEDALRKAQEELVQTNKDLEKRIEERTASLREAIAQMEEFSYTVSHDLRAPLRGMKAYTDALLQDFAGALPEDAMHYLNRISVNANRLDKMILDVLTFSRLARAEFPLEPVAVDKLVRQIVEQYPGMQAPQAQIKVEPLPEVLGHEPSLTQALSNLLNNAVKFVPPNVTPQVRVWAEPRNGHVRLWVEDNGIGIDPQYQRRLFNMFERIHSNPNYDGTGVGLAIVRKAAERMGGRVGMESDGVNGCRFWLECRAANPVNEPFQAASLLLKDTATA